MMQKQSNHPAARKTALITGASSGIGKAFAEVFAQNGFDLVLTARRESRLQALGKNLEQRYDTRHLVVPLDLADPLAPEALFKQITDQGMTVDALVNNAGYGVPGSFIDHPWKTHADFMQVLMTAVAHLCYLFLPGMIERGYGRIINVSSLNGIVPGSPFQTLYSGAKSFVVQLSQTLSMEVKHSNVNITAVCPGLTYSEFHDVTGTREQIGNIASYRWMDAETVARQGYDAVMKGDPLCINGRFNKIVYLLAKWLPNKKSLEMVARTSQKMRSKHTAR